MRVEINPKNVMLPDEVWDDATRGLSKPVFRKFSEGDIRKYKLKKKRRKMQRESRRRNR